ncbi:hypothetical protein S245_042942, partial [Arachis hypogaea]
EQNPHYLGEQKNPSSLALCPATKNCISTYENITHTIHYAPTWFILMHWMEMNHWLWTWEAWGRV